MASGTTPFFAVVAILSDGDCRGEKSTSYRTSFLFFLRGICKKISRGFHFFGAKPTRPHLFLWYAKSFFVVVVVVVFIPTSYIQAHR